MEIDYAEVGSRIKHRRKELGMSQEKLAELIDVSVPHMSNIENGKTRFSLQVLVDLTNALNTRQVLKEYDRAMKQKEK